ncbi:MAG: HAMP domain-containing protein, partial [Thermoplasmata archaeon]|nr:HAMP domain-containing protein [Thermoplasmata archaeon]
DPTVVAGGIPCLVYLGSKQHTYETGIGRYWYKGVDKWTAYAPVNISSKATNLNDLSIACSSPVEEFAAPAVETEAALLLQSQQINTTLSTTLDDVNTTLSTILDDVNTALSTTQDNVNATLSTILDNVNATLSTTQSDMNATLSTTLNDMNAALSTTQGDVETSISEEVNALQIGIYAIIILIIIIDLILASLLAGAITKPLREITEIADRVSTGDMEAQISIKATGDEVGDLVHSFDRMVKSLKIAMSMLEKGEMEGAEQETLEPEAPKDSNDT